jgi:oligopeptide transport system ATP-binding protein
MNDLVEVKNLKKYFPVTGGIFGKKIGDIKAVDNLSFSVKKGETLGIVGESGSGKSTTGRLILRLLEPTDGTINFEGKSVHELSKSKLKALREDMQLIFQDPFASLNPRHTIQRILEEPLIVHKKGTKQERRKKVQEMLEVVGLDTYYAKRYPHQFSGGQRQRIGIARALMTQPKLVILDEPVSALDVSIQSQIINLLKDLQEEFHLTYIFIAHDLSVVRQISDRVGVMYLGTLVELTDSEKLYERPLHPYTQALLSAIPIPDPDVKEEQEDVLGGEIPSPSNPPEGCVFHTRCKACMEICKAIRPPFKEIEEGHYVACHLYE